MTKPLPPTEQPEPFLTVRVHEVLNPSFVGLCVGYEQKKWRIPQFVKHVFEWLPEFSLSSQEYTNLRHSNAVALLRRAAQTVYETNKFKKRGEFGELLLHIAVRQVYNSTPAISKIYYKSAMNDTVKGFDAVHIVGAGSDLELWLGEAKFYTDIDRAITDVVAELAKHTELDYLRSEFLLISGKVDASHAHAQAIQRLLSPNTSLDDVFERTCIPILLTYDSECLSRYKDCSQAYIADFVSEVKAHSNAFYAKIASKKLPQELRICLFLLPLCTKEELVREFDKVLKQWHKI